MNKLKPFIFYGILYLKPYFKALFKHTLTSIYKLWFCGVLFLFCLNCWADKLPQTITFTGIPNKTCNDSIVTLLADATSGLPVTFDVFYGSAVIEGNILTILGAGTITVSASQPGDATYDSATPVYATFEVTSEFYSSNVDFRMIIDTSVCEGNSLNLSATSIAGISYMWTTPNNSSVYSGTYHIASAQTANSGPYELKVWQGKCVFFEYNFHVSVHEAPLVSISGLPSDILIGDPPISLELHPVGGILQGNGTSDTFFSPSSAGMGTHTISYTYTDLYKCSNTVYANVNVIANVNIYEIITSMPNSRHNTWLIENIESYTDNEVFVYNSWGNLVYNKKGYNNSNGWDGGQLPAGSYLYVVKILQSNKTYEGTLFIEK